MIKKKIKFYTGLKKNKKYLRYLKVKKFKKIKIAGLYFNLFNTLKNLKIIKKKSVINISMLLIKENFIRTLSRHIYLKKFFWTRYKLINKKMREVPHNYNFISVDGAGIRWKGNPWEKNYVRKFYYALKKKQKTKICAGNWYKRYSTN